MLKKITVATVVALSVASGIGSAFASSGDSRSDRIRSECAKTMNPAECNATHR